MKTLDILVFLFYIIGVTVFGSTFYRKNKDSSSFTLGKNNLPGWVITMSIFATFVSSISYLAMPGSAYQSNWNAFVFSLSLPISAIFAVVVFVPLYRRVNSPSAYTYLEQRFGSWARIYASFMYLLTQLMRIGTILYLMALLIHSIFGWDVPLVIIVTGLLIMVYSTLGGIQAVVWTDAVQGILLIGGAVVCAGYIFLNMPEGPSQVLDIAQRYDKFNLGGFSLQLNEPTFWVVLVYGVFINLQNYGIDQNYVQRYMASKTEKEAKRSAFWGGLMYIPVSALFLFIGTALFAFYESKAAQLPAELLDKNKGDQVFPYFIANELPTGFTGLLVAAVFAAGMSTISTSYNSSATVILTDFFGKERRSEKSEMIILYMATLVIGLIGMVIGLSLINVKSALDSWWKLASVFSGGMLGLFLLGVFSKQKNTGGAIVGVILGLLVILGLSLVEALPFEIEWMLQLHTYLSIVVGTSVIFLVGFTIGLIRKKEQT